MSARISLAPLQLASFFLVGVEARALCGEINCTLYNIRRDADARRTDRFGACKLRRNFFMIELQLEVDVGLPLWLCSCDY